MKLALLLIAALPLLAAGEAYDKAKEKVSKKVADDLCGVARWCDGEEYYMERDRFYELALVYVSDHKKARVALKYVRGDDGEWVQSDEYQPDRNHGRVDFEALEKQESRVWERWAKSMVSAIEKNEDDLTEEELETELRSILTRFPDHARVRKRLGYVEGWEGHKWVTPAAKRAYERRKEIKGFAKARRKKAPGPTESPLEDYEQECDISWNSHLETDLARVVNTAGKKETELALELIEAAPKFVADVLETGVGLPSGMTAYLVDSKELLPALIEHVPGARGPSVKGVGSWWATGSTLFVGTGNRAGRLDLLSTQAIHHLLGRGYGLTGKQGWAFEGFGLYLSYKLCGTRLSYSVRPTEYVGGDKNRGSRLRASDANWLEEAHGVMSADKPPSLPFVFGKDVNQLTDVDLLVGYGLAAYVLEAHADKAAAILGRLASEPAVTVLEEELNTQLDRLQRDLTEWLGEVY
jgi:hypothetical protein